MKKYYFRILFVASIIVLLIISYLNYVHKYKIKYTYQKYVDQNDNTKKPIQLTGQIFEIDKPIILEQIMPKQKNNLLCIILTSKKTIFQRCDAIYDTWAQNCTKTVFACNCKDIQNDKNLTDNKMKFLKKINILHLPIKESYDRMAEKVLIILKIVFKLFGENFSWFLLVDDDTYVYTRNVFKFIDNHDYKLPLTYGYNFKQVVPTGYHSGGGGTLITHESLKRLSSKITSNQCPFREGYGDVALGQCSAIADVKLGSSIDSSGRERFHPLDAASHFHGNFPDWIFSYATNKVKSGIECCSLDSISFHYVSSADMYEMSRHENYLGFLKRN